MGNTIQINIKTNSAEVSEILIAELSDLKFYAFQEEENSLLAFVKEENFNEDVLKEFLSNKNLSYNQITITETNWNAKWESEFEPIIVDQFVTVRAPFHQPVLNVKHEIIITPKMSFGTGHHATTYLMLQQMQHIDFRNKTVLDFGTGTGILAILAKKLGAKKVVALDNDSWSINNAQENINANHCKDIILLQKEDLKELETFDVILANINLNVLTEHSVQLNQITDQNSKLLLSGFLLNDEEKITESFSKLGFSIVSPKVKDNWLCMLITKS